MPEAAAAASSPSGSQRLLSLDVFRGLTIAGMILVNSPGNDTAYRQLDHSAWNGLTFTDLVFPFFVFIVGVSLVFAFTKRQDRGESKGDIFLQAIKRTAVIFGLGLVLNGFPLYHLSSIRILGVLQRIALCYLAASIFFLWSNAAAEAAAAAVLLVGYAWLMTHVAAPGFTAGDLSKEGNLAAFIDRLFLSGHMYRPVYDPEGLLSTLPAIATALLGNLTGRWLRGAWMKTKKTAGMLQAGAILLLVGWKWSFWFPVNKALWTSSYVLVTGGLALVLLSLCYWLIEVKGWRSWSKAFQIFGVNAIAAYFLHVFFLKVQNLRRLPRLDGTPGNLRIYLTEHLFQPWMSPVNASLCYAVAYTLLWLAVLGVLYRRKIFIKV